MIYIRIIYLLREQVFSPKYVKRQVRQMESIEQIIGYHCAPAIRGIKVANLVALPQHLGAMMVEKTLEYNDKFNQKGLFFYELCHCEKRKLLLVFRERMLEDYLQQPEVLAFLQNYGYESYETLAEWLLHLRQRIEMSDVFPHEIGVFLGYPLEDVKAFIQFRGAGYKVCGDWKVYGNQASAMHAFHCFRMCRDYCHAQLNKGKSLESLVAVTAC